MRSPALLAVLLSACAGAHPADPGVDPDAPTAVPDAAPAPDDAAPPARTPKLLLVGLDGVRHDKLAVADIPALRGLADRGLSSITWLYGSPMAGTWSGPGWSSIATGVWPDKHQVHDNGFGGHHLADYPDFLSRLEAARPALVTWAISDWEPLTDDASAGPVFGAAIDERVTRHPGSEGGWVACDELITAAAEARLAGDLDAAFVYLGNVDIIGHGGDTGAGYIAAIETNDAQIGRMLDEIEARPTYADEDWLVVVVTDHGHYDWGGHGGNEPVVRQSWIIAAGGGLPQGAPAIEPRDVDIVPTVLAHFGVAIDPAWGLDGVALGAASADPFDTAIDRLQPAVDETGLPILGWTREAPTGWTIDNGAMTPGGTTEWRGWSLAHEEFFARTDPNQGRESFARARGVIAVADPDEWDDTGSPSSSGRFDSTLRSPPWPITGGTTTNLRFASHYRQDGVQKGDVIVSFDVGSPQVVLHYGPDSTDANAGGDVISRLVTLPIAVPRGATTMSVAWRLYDAGNDWYWAIDDPRVF